MEKEHFEILLEEMNSKFSLVLEGHAALDKKFDAKFDVLNEKIEQTNFKLGVVNDNLTKRINELDERLSTKLDAVAADLSEHRADTEAHHGVYRVKEDDPEYK